MPIDYDANSKRSKEERQPQPDDPKVEKVVTAEVITRKKPLGRRFKDIFVSVDAKSVLTYVFGSVLIPAARDMIVDASTEGVKRMMYGDDNVRRRTSGNVTGSRFSYQTPVSRDSLNRHALPSSGRTSRVQRQPQDEVILSTRDDADLVLERMDDIVQTYEVVSMHDLNELLGRQSTHIDNRWGWTSLVGTQIRQIREGYLLDLPPVEPI